MSLERTTTRVLVVEDGLTEARKLEAVLKSCGFEVVVARDGLAGITAFEASRFDLVLSDVRMPGATGYELCRQIKASSEGREVPVVLLTSLSKPLDVIQGLECGADNFLNKPYDAETLVERINAILAHRALRGENEGRSDNDVVLMGKTFTINAGKGRVLDFLASAFDDLFRAKQRDHEGELARQRQRSEAETFRVREELLQKEKETLRQLHRFLQSTLDALSARIAILDESGVILAVNAAWGSAGEVDPLVGLSCGVGANYLASCVSANDPEGEAAAVAAGMGDVLAQRRDSFAREYPGLDSSAWPKRWYSVRVTRFTGPGPTRLVVSHEEVTERRRADEALRQSEERYALAARGANDGLWDWDLKADEIYYAPRWKAMLGCEDDQIGNSPEDWFGRVHPLDLGRVKAEIAAHLDGLTPHFESEHRVRHADGTYRWMHSRGLALRDANSWAVRMAGSQTDITKRKAAEEQLLHDAFHDPLTGLPNRALFTDRLDRATRRTRQRPSQLFAVLFLDLDSFKVVNDSLGHLAGDQLLIAIGKRLVTCLRDGDTVARLGGDEFAILVDDIKHFDDASSLADRILDELGLPFNLGGHEVYASASIGIALSASGCDRPDNLLRDADTAMYRAKALGKKRHVVFDVAMHENVMARLKLETDLRRAIEREEIWLAYQPIVVLETGVIAGFEALARWQHPEWGVISPTQFIATAEETGLIIPLGHWVLREACRQMRGWQTRFPACPPLSISVNVSTKQLCQPDLIEQIDRILAETGLPGSSLRLEITESVIMENTDKTNAVLRQLRSRGLGLSMDDFGTGYSSLSYLHRLPLDGLKIDRSFTSRMEDGGGEPGIVRTIVSLAHELGMHVVAEGIETESQLAHLRELGCEYGQGYLFSRPTGAEQAESLLAERSELAVATCA